MGKRVLSDIEKEYYKNRRRIQGFIRSAQKRGYVFAESALPKIPKTITQASVRNLQRLTPNKLYGKAMYVMKETGQVLTSQQGRYHERKKAAQKAKVTVKKKKPQAARANYYKSRGKVRKVESGVLRPPSFSQNVLEDMRSKLSSWAPSGNWPSGLQAAKQHDKNALQKMLDDAIAQEGEDAVALRLQENAVRIADLTMEILYASGSKEGNFKDGRTQVNADLVEMATILKGRALSIDEAISMTELRDLLEVNN